jgi:hypothetical protein
MRESSRPKSLKLFSALVMLSILFLLPIVGYSDPIYVWSRPYQEFQANPSAMQTWCADDVYITYGPFAFPGLTEEWYGSEHLITCYAF